MKSIGVSLKTRFLAGVIVIVPLIATFLALRFLLVQLDGIFGPLLERLVGRYVPGLGLLVTLVVVFLAGLTATNFLGRRLLRWTDRLLEVLPFVKLIYRASRDIVQTATGSRRQLFREVVMIEYPRRGMHSYGFVTSYTTRRGLDGAAQPIANVFIPGPPVPTTGVLVAVPVEELIRLDMPAEDALKMILSGGMVCPPELRLRASDGGGGGSLDRP